MDTDASEGSDVSGRRSLTPPPPADTSENSLQSSFIATTATEGASSRTTVPLSEASTESETDEAEKISVTVGVSVKTATSAGQSGTRVTEVPATSASLSPTTAGPSSSRPATTLIVDICLELTSGTAKHLSGRSSTRSSIYGDDVEITSQPHHGNGDSDSGDSLSCPYFDLLDSDSD